jgi:hypothetical protein
MNLKMLLAFYISVRHHIILFLFNICFFILFPSPWSCFGHTHSCLLNWVLRQTNTVLVKWRHCSFTDGGRPQMPFRALFQVRTGTRVDQPTFRKLGGQLPDMKESNVFCRDSNPQRWGANGYKSTTLTTLPQTPQFVYVTADIYIWISASRQMNFIIMWHLLRQWLQLAKGGYHCYHCV